jgi:signal peptidase I
MGLFSREPAHDGDERQRSMVWEVLKYTIVSLILVAPFRIYVAQPFIVSGESMIDTFHPQEYLVVDQLTYRREEPKRGDVVAFKYPLDPSIYFVKRLIGLPGETIRINNRVVTVQSASSSEPVRLDEPYVTHLAPTTAPLEITLEEDEYFLLGDNRKESSDSRVWGPLQKKFIVGRAFARVFPLSRMEVWPGEHRYER